MGSGAGDFVSDPRYVLWMARVAGLLIVVLSLLWVVGYTASPPGFDPGGLEPILLLQRSVIRITAANRLFDPAGRRHKRVGNSEGCALRDRF